MKRILYIIPLLLLCCTNKKPAQQTLQPADFSADSAYQFVAAQVALGARVPGSEAHFLCTRYIEQTLERYGAEMLIEQGQMTNYAGEVQQIYNITASFHPERQQRILLAAHYDTRPWADQEEIYEHRYVPILGANDGASGVGVLLEIARHAQNLNAGIDLVFFDCEDMGTPSFYTGQEREDTWCLGSQLWAKQHAVDKSRYKYGIVLDMVGGYDAVFPKEYFSMQYAEQWVEQLWHTAHLLGYGNYFTNQLSYPITDDHYYVNRLAGIPCLDLIHYEQTETGFPYYWHTQADDMTHISRETLRAVGTTILTNITK